jgi:hypothetical protein
LIAVPVKWLADDLISTFIGKILRRPVLLAIVTLSFIVSAAICLILSGLLFQGWWQGFFLALGVGLLVAGIVDVGVIGALHGLIEGEPTRRSADDGLDRLVSAAAGNSVDLSWDEFDAIRQLLEDPQTWKLLGYGHMDDLASRIADVLVPRDERTAEDLRITATAIALGLLKFTAADLDPKLFQQVLLARIERMQSDQVMLIRELGAEIVRQLPQ